MVRFNFKLPSKIDSSFSGFPTDCSDLSTLKPRHFYTQKVGNATEYFSIFVYWEFDCQQCPLENYSIRYCVDNDRDCDDSNEIAIKNLNGKFEMSSLEPYNTYKIQMFFEGKIVAETFDDTDRLGMP
jgi:hypothetical protein